jgi:hypothetical protein
MAAQDVGLEVGSKRLAVQAQVTVIVEAFPSPSQGNTITG